MVPDTKEPLLDIDPRAELAKPGLEGACLRPFELMVLGATICTVVNSMVGYLHVPLPALIQGRYFLQWVISLAALCLRSKASGKPFQPFGPPGQRCWLIV